MRVYLSGMPELRLGLNDKVLFESTGSKYQLPGRQQTLLDLSHLSLLPSIFLFVNLSLPALDFSFLFCKMDL